MSPLFSRLNLKSQTEILVLNAPDSFDAELESLEGITVLDDLRDSEEISFLLAFVTEQDDLDEIAEEMAKQAKGDAVIWFAYPKLTSRKYKCSFDRDTGWTVLGQLGFEGVRQVAIDADWSALRFRRVEFIKKMTRDPSRAMTAEGQARVKKE